MTKKSVDYSQPYTKQHKSIMSMRFLFFDSTTDMSRFSVNIQSSQTVWHQQDFFAGEAQTRAPRQPQQASVSTCRWLKGWMKAWRHVGWMKVCEHGYWYFIMCLDSFNGNY